MNTKLLFEIISPIIVILLLKKLFTWRELISGALACLWVYAAVSKLLDYPTFRVQLAKSPLLTGFSGIIAVVLPVTELVIAALLLIRRFNTSGLYFSLVMLVMFTFYLLFILNFSYYIPCSCGGILQGFSWKGHIIFNIACIAINITGIINHKSTGAAPGNRLTQPI
ncbi:MauE/DoxX family redox-associated membrane protein [Mucilaginibacter paludis]|uniref:Methylamine utilisation protein MauE domain-containing protein n=1 Tax=Mucilaginibacter paludis DSM 18603 TaxID=714943 RepID=H1YDV4_9SPHI|nr:MauE/DoxX family redox-associated membrane protein [Mucilaginibacter paludis]EHQ24294.1 hypothetical protein Mucpa_0091 [Mucilaginibacter paludis DSM 18603]